jgi:hypothetical protein
MQFRARLLECSAKGQGNPQAEPQFSRDAAEITPMMMMMMMMMMILIYVQGTPKYSRPPEGYRDVLS